MSGLDHESKNRLRLWLRGERAFGLSAIPLELSEAPAAAPVHAALPEPVARPLPARPAPAVLRDARLSGQEVAVPKREPKPAAQVPAEQPALLPTPSAPGFTAPLLAREEKIVRLKMMDDNEVKACTRCRMHEAKWRSVKSSPSAAHPHAHATAARGPETHSTASLLGRPTSTVNSRSEVGNVILREPRSNVPGNAAPSLGNSTNGVRATILCRRTQRADSRLKGPANVYARRFVLKNATVRCQASLAAAAS